MIHQVLLSLQVGFSHGIEQEDTGWIVFVSWDPPKMVVFLLTVSL